MLQPLPVSIQPLFNSEVAKKGVEVAVMRLDQIHHLVSGNKFFKLKYNLEEAKKLGKKGILTFGGAFSNHIYATAFAANLAEFQSIGIIRGEEASRANPTLAHAERIGMQLHFVDRESYRRKNSSEFLGNLRARFGDFYLIPEGGTNTLAILGSKEILTESSDAFTHICVSIGTGGTFVGLAASLKCHQKLLGFSSLKGDFIHQEIETLLSTHQIYTEGSLEIRNEYHFGGYGKHKLKQIEFMKGFYSEFKIPLDPIYTGKMFFGVWDLITKDHFPAGSKILLIHTGGLQGNAGFKAKTGIDLPTL
jgi:1-aminocyclopropane-1-carboxylate deaminase